MSRTPSSQCGHSTPDSAYIEPDSQHHRTQVSMTYHPYPRHEPRHFLPPDIGYSRPVPSTQPGPRLPSIGHFPERNVDPSHMPTSDNGYKHHSSIPHTLPLRMHHYDFADIDPRGDPPAPYAGRSNPMLSHGREYSHRVRTHDLESQ